MNQTFPVSRNVMHNLSYTAESMDAEVRQSSKCVTYRHISRQSIRCAKEGCIAE